MYNKYWQNIDKLEDYMISYILYKEGKPLRAISIIRSKSYKEVEEDIIRAKISINKNRVEKQDGLVDLISLTKESRIEVLKNMNQFDKDKLVDEIYSRYTNFKSTEDRIILIWLIGELKAEKLLMHLRMELRSRRVNHRRLACSALGKIKNPISKPWLEGVIFDNNPQVRQYAVRALADIGDLETIEKLRILRAREEKAYVIKNIDRTIDIILERSKDGKGI